MNQQTISDKSPRHLYTIPYLPVLDALDLSSNEIILEQTSLRLPIMINNWPDQYPYIPITAADLAYSDTGLYCRFQSRGKGLLAQYIEDGSKVHEDSCVEIFLQLPGQERYYNFEFNCIGTCDASHRLNREVSTPFTGQQYDHIHRAASERRDVLFERPRGLQSFYVSVKIDFQVLGIESVEQLPEYFMGNLYKCGDRTPEPHFATWQPVHTETPDFHRPEYFQPLYLGPRE
ncbi:MAG: carbohydrate-binding family 9-like protein [Porphyromonas sp.]|nr:carbohydrate-binding family 9-like protein [Porphyromonas sp.]